MLTPGVTRNPARIGRYELITALAAGGMGRIYLGRTAGPGGFERKVVIKTLEMPLTAQRDPAVEMFLDEARLLGYLHHQHIASVFEVGCDEDGRHYMVIDYLDGRNLQHVWERALQYGAALPLDFTLTVTSAVANALHYAHTRTGLDGAPLGIVHRDVSPSNVMIGHDGAVQLIDFGIALAAERKTKTETGLVKGKIGYLSPEQVAGRDVDARTDVFALGILLYELSTMQRAFRDSSDLATMQRIKAGRVTRPSLVVPSYPLELELIVMKALHVDPRERFPDANTLRRAVEALGHRLHLVLGDAAIMEVMEQLFESSAAGAAPERASDAVFEWSETDYDRTVRRDADDLLAALRAETAYASRKQPSGETAATTVLPPRKLRAATEMVDALIEQSTLAPILPLPSPPDTPPGILQPDLLASGLGKPAVAVVRLPSARAPAPAQRAAAAARSGSSMARFGAGVVAARSSRGGLRWIAAGIAGAIAATTIYLVLREIATPKADAVAQPPASAALTAPAAAGSAAPAAPAPPPASPVPASPPAPAPGGDGLAARGAAPGKLPSKVRVRITSRPADATVMLDSKRLGHTPLDEVVDADAATHVIRLRRRGYAVSQVEVTLSADIDQDVTLIPQR